MNQHNNLNRLEKEALKLVKMSQTINGGVKYVRF